jgi:hypothetical protein
MGNSWHSPFVRRHVLIVDISENKLWVSSSVGCPHNIKRHVSDRVVRPSALNEASRYLTPNLRNS